jgi:hypothetical protein
MGSVARRRGAYGGEYLRAGLRLHALEVEENWAKYLVKLGQKATENISLTATSKN